MAWEPWLCSSENDNQEPRGPDDPAPSADAPKDNPKPEPVVMRQWVMDHITEK